MRRFKIKEGTDVSGLEGHKSGGVYEFDRADHNGDIWLKVDNAYGSWCYLTSELEEVFDNDGGTIKPLHKDTDLGYFAGLAMQGLLAGIDRRDIGEEKELAALSIDIAKELIKQLDETK